MIINTTNKRNLNFLLLFGVFFSLSTLEFKADPVFSVYKSRVNNNGNTKDILRAKNNIYVNNFKKLNLRDQKNNLFKKIQGKNSLDPNYKNNIFNNWTISEIEKDLDSKIFYMDEYRSRLHPFDDHIFYDHYLSQMQGAKKEHHSFRKFLHNFRLHLSTGISGSFDKTSIQGYFFEDNGNYFVSPLYQSHFNNYAYQIGWFGETYKKVPVSISPDTYNQLETNDKIYKGWIKSLDLIDLGISYDIYKRLRLQINYKFKLSNIKSLKRQYQTAKNSNNIHSIASPVNVDTMYLPKPTFLNSNLGFLIGSKILNNTLWSVLINFQIYFTFFYRNFKIVDGNFVHGFKSSYPGWGTGVTVERHLSDYISIFTKGTFGVARMDWNVQGDKEKCMVTHSFTTFSWDFGINFTSSYIDKCDNEHDCKIKEVHIHDSKEYRGLSKWNYKSPYGKVIHSAK